MGVGDPFSMQPGPRAGLRELSSDRLQHTHVRMYVRMYVYMYVCVRTYVCTYMCMYVMTRQTSGEGDKCAYRSEYRMIDSNPFLSLLFSFP